MVVNLSEKSYNGPSKFPNGKVFKAGWSTNPLSPVTPLETVLKTVEETLAYLAADKGNVVVVHCLDGRSNTAVLVAALLMAVGFAHTFRDALKFFALKR